MRHKQQRLLEQNIQRLESYIKEHKLDVTPEDMILTITDADPDYANFKNSKWLIKNLLNKNFLWEDIESGKSSKAYDTLSRFLNIRKQWKSLGPNFLDINQYTGLSGIAEKIRPFEITKGMNELKREEKAKIYEETIVLYDKNDYLVVIPTTEEASCFWGRNTEWCTASTQSENYFDHYNKSGPLIIAITPDNKKYQFHKNSSPMDENDKEIKEITDPVLIELALSTEKIANIKHIDYTNFRHCELTVQQNGLAIKQIDKDIENYSYLCELAVQQNGWALQYVDKDVKNYFKICELAVKQNGLAIKQINKDIENYSYLCELAVQQNGYSIQHIDNDVENYFKICELAVNQNGLIIYHINKDIPEYSEICKLAVQKYSEAIEYIDKDIPEYLEICKLALQNNGLAIKYIDKNIPKYPELARLAVQQNGLAIRDIDKDAPEYLELARLAVQQNGRAIYYIKQNSKLYDKDIMNELYFIAVKQDGPAIRDIDKDVENYSYLCELAVQQNGRAIVYIDKDIPGYLELCKLAVQQNNIVINFIDKNIPGYSELYDLINHDPESEYESESEYEIIQTNNISIIPEWLTNKNYEEIIANLEMLKSSKPEKTLTNDLF